MAREILKPDFVFHLEEVRRGSSCYKFAKHEHNGVSSIERKFYAHTNSASSSPTEGWEPLLTVDCPALDGGSCGACERLERQHGHLNKVAWWTAKFASGLFPARSDDAKAGWEWGYLAGLWHDLGKFAPEWQDYLTRKAGADTHEDEAAEKVDHATAGAKHAVQVGGTLGHLLAYVISGHHSGLLDATSERACLEKRLAKAVYPPIGASPALLQRPIPKLPRAVSDPLLTDDGPTVTMLFTRLLFSALVDADFLATEAFMNPEQSCLRSSASAPLLPRMADLLDQHLAGLFIQSDVPPGAEVPGQRMSRALVDRARADVLAACREKAAERPGLFSLTVPTGGGKTLSSLAFALRHALAHGQQRVIYVIPFTSIIEQNATVFEGVFRELVREGEGPVVLQHHSNLSPRWETTRSRLAAENWDAPLIVTTAVQFYESLHAARTSGCRKLHHIANAVVILDEAQCLPVEYLRPCLDLLRELTIRHHTTAVLCTATQPEVGWSEDFSIGLKDVREIVPDREALYTTLRRVKVVDRGALTDETLAQEIAEQEQVLAIVNTRDHAQKLFARLPQNEGNFHLSARMCPVHRQAVLRLVRARLRKGWPTRLISTQLVEAGVDVDFPRVYRALAGLDSIAQAAGRCNRNGKLAEGELHLFRSEHQRAEAYFRDTAQKAEEVLALYPDDVLGLKSIQKFFTLYYQQHRPATGQPWDAKDIHGKYKLVRGNPKLPFQFQFKEAAEGFRLIENEQVSVLVPYDQRAKALLAKLRNENVPLHRDLLRGLQRYSVQIYKPDFQTNLGQLEPVRDGQFHILSYPDAHYSQQFGLNFERASPLLYV